MNLRLLSSFIIKTKNPCVNCINYMKYKYVNIDKFYRSEPKIGFCSLFGEQHLVTGEMQYNDALECRLNASKCGKEGKYYNKKCYQK